MPTKPSAKSMRPVAVALADRLCTRRARSTSVGHVMVDAAIEPERTKAEIDAGELPWAYGEDRITAIVRDPDSAFLYWEFDRRGRSPPRERVSAPAESAAGATFESTTRPGASSTARTRTTTSTSARSARPRVLRDDPPARRRRCTSRSACKTHEGFFQPIARSGRADFPRSGPRPIRRLEWMTVTSDDAPPCVAPYRSRYTGPEPPLPGREGAGYVDVWRAGYAPSTQAERARRGGEADAARRRTEHRSFERHRGAHIERWWRLDEWRAEWRSGLRFFRLGALRPPARRGRAARRDAGARGRRGRRDAGLSGPGA